MPVQLDYQRSTISEAKCLVLEDLIATTSYNKPNTLLYTEKLTTEATSDCSSKKAVKANDDQQFYLKLKLSDLIIEINDELFCADSVHDQELDQKISIIINLVKKAEKDKLVEELQLLAKTDLSSNITIQNSIEKLILTTEDQNDHCTAILLQFANETNFVNIYYIHNNVLTHYIDDCNNYQQLFPESFLTCLAYFAYINVPEVEHSLLETKIISAYNIAKSKDNIDQEKLAFSFINHFRYHEFSAKVFAILITFIDQEDIDLIGLLLYLLSKKITQFSHLKNKFTSYFEKLIDHYQKSIIVIKSEFNEHVKIVYCVLDILAKTDFNDKEKLLEIATKSVNHITEKRFYEAIIAKIEKIVL